MEQNQNEPKINDIKVDRKSKVLFAILAILIAGSVTVTYWRYMVQRDYVVESQIDCDPETEKCFIWQCDPESTVEGEQCTGVPDNDIWYYKIFRRNAKNIPDCDPTDENCPAYVCGEEEQDCAEELCTVENVAQGEECNDPEQYLLENPPEEECAEDDEECLAEQESADAECEEGDEECLMEEESAETECAEDDQECLDAQNAECDPESEDCPAASGEECAPDDENCETTPAEESAPADSLENNTPSSNPPPDKNIPPPGVEPQ